MFISDPHKGIIFHAVRGIRWGKYRWHAVDLASLAETRVPASQVPRRIRKAAYSLYWRDTQREEPSCLP
jgi:hypothetical protein